MGIVLLIIFSSGFALWLIYVFVFADLDYKKSEKKWNDFLDK